MKSKFFDSIKNTFAHWLFEGFSPNAPNFLSHEMQNISNSGLFYGILDN